MLARRVGCALHEPGTYLEAIAAYQKSLELNPGQLEVLVNLGDAYLHLDRPEEARTILARAGTLESNDAKLHHRLAELYLNLGMRAEAVREHETLRRLDPSLAHALTKLLDVLPKCCGRDDHR
jgi:tetratricopeptide (TPR) repeat protein